MIIYKKWDDLFCENKGICCKLADGKSHCDCPNEYEGKTVGNSIGVCEGYCNGNGKCLFRLGTQRYECLAGYWGKHCQSDSCTDYWRNFIIGSNTNGSKIF